MRMAFRGTATAMALALAWAAAVGCSSGGHAAHTAATAAPAAPAAPTATSPAATAPAAAKITGTAFNEDADGARIVLSANAPLLYTSYEPRPDLLVVDLRDASMAAGVTTPKTGGLVESIKFEELDELGKRITRLSITHNPDAHADLRSVGQGLAIGFSGPATNAEAEAPAAAAPPVETATVQSAPLTPAEKPVATTTAAAAIAPKAAPAAAPAKRGELAHSLESVTAETRNGKVAILLLGDGWFSAKDFTLANPPRIVVDLPGVKNDVKQRTIVVKDDVVSRVRVSQFQTSPEYVTRVVVDLARPMPHALVPDGERLAVVVGENATADAMAQATVQPEPRRPSRSEASSPPTWRRPPPRRTSTRRRLRNPRRRARARRRRSRRSSRTRPRANPPLPRRPNPRRRPRPSWPACRRPRSRLRCPPRSRSRSRRSRPRPSRRRPPRPSPRRRRRRSPSRPPRRHRRNPPTSRGDALFEAAAAQLDQEQTSPAQGGGAYRSRTLVGSAEPVHRRAGVARPQGRRHQGRLPDHLAVDGAEHRHRPRSARDGHGTARGRALGPGARPDPQAEQPRLRAREQHHAHRDHLEAPGRGR